MLLLRNYINSHFKINTMDRKDLKTSAIFEQTSLLPVNSALAANISDNGMDKDQT